MLRVVDENNDGTQDKEVEFAFLILITKNDYLDAIYLELDAINKIVSSFKEGSLGDILNVDGKIVRFAPDGGQSEFDTTVVVKTSELIGMKIINDKAADFV